MSNPKIYYRKRDILQNNLPVKFIFYTAVIAFLLISTFKADTFILYILTVPSLIFVLYILFSPENEEQAFTNVIVFLVVLVLFILDIVVTFAIAFSYLFVLSTFHLFFIPTITQHFWDLPLYQQVLDFIETIIIPPILLFLFVNYTVINLEKIVDFFKFSFLKHYFASKLISFTILVLVTFLIYLYPNFYKFILPDVVHEIKMFLNFLGFSL